MHRISSFDIDNQQMRYYIVMVAVMGAAYALLYKWLEQSYLTPETPMYLSPFFCSSMALFTLVLVAAFVPKPNPHIARIALVISLLTHGISYPLSFTYVLGMHNVQQDAILVVAHWNTVNYMIAFSIFTMRRALICSIFVYLAPLCTWLYFVHIYASYETLGVSPRDFSTLALTGLMNLTLCAVLKSMTYIATEARMMAKLAVRDSLTGLPNRLYLDDFFKETFSRRQQAGLTTSIAICDIDSFKQVNDTYSHKIGDSVLQQFAQILQENIRSSDIVGRYGGEEFLLIFLDVPAAEAANICESLRVAVEQHDWTRIHPALHITASFGISDNTQVTQHDTTSAIVHYADLKMYQAKNRGRNQVRF